MDQLYTPWCVTWTTVLVTSESKQKPFLSSNKKRYTCFCTFCTCKVIILKKQAFFRTSLQTTIGFLRKPPPPTSTLNLIWMALLCCAFDLGLTHLHLLMNYLMMMMKMIFRQNKPGSKHSICWTEHCRPKCVCPLCRQSLNLPAFNLLFGSPLFQALSYRSCT